MSEEPVPVELTVAVVEDTPSASEPLIEAIREAGSYRVESTNDFNQALSLVAPNSTIDVLVLDWYDDSLPDDNASGGRDVWREVWKHRLMPVVVWSAHEFSPDLHFPTNNPLFKFIKKGVGSEEEVVAFLEEIRPLVEAIRLVQQDLESASRSVLLDTAPLVWPITAGQTDSRSDILRRMTRRRLAASLDTAAEDSTQTLAHWEHYILPPLGSFLMMGDILRATDGDPSNPESFRVVITPSCDLELNKGKCKVESVLVSKCGTVEGFLNVVGGSGDKLRENLPRHLREPHLAGYVALPAFGTAIPNMAADLRDLELLSIAGLLATADGPGRFERVASIDSPFREYFAWAYLQITGRPGIPKRDLGPWVAQLVPDAKK